MKLVPSGSAFTMDKLMSSDAYIEASGRGVMIEYILIADVNDTDDEAKALADRCRGVRTSPESNSIGRPRATRMGISRQAWRR